MFKLKEVIEDKDKKYIKNINIYGTVLDIEFDNGKDELLQSEINEINIDLKQRWLK